MSLHHLGFAGSLSLRPDTLTGIVVDLLDSAYQHGFRHILVLNGHGGNVAPIQVALIEVLNELHGLVVQVGHWWREPQVAAVFEEAFPGSPPSHADAGETSAVLAIRPEAVHLERAQHSPGAPRVPFLTKYAFLEHYPHGVIGLDPRQGSAEVGERAIAAAVDVYEGVLQAWAKGP
jgi:creatinine amidohydrolase